MYYKISLFARFRHWIIRIIASGDLIVLNAKITIEKRKDHKFLYLNIDGGMVAYNDFDVGNNVIVLENNKVN